MDETKKNSYMAGGIFALIGIVFLYAGFSSRPISLLIVIFGLIFCGLGGATFKYPQIGEVLFHWMKKQSGETSHRTQHQGHSKNSPQVHNEGGTVIINQNISENNKRKK